MDTRPWQKRRAAAECELKEARLWHAIAMASGDERHAEAEERWRAADAAAARILKGK